MKEQLVDRLADLIELYFSLDCRTQTGSIVKSYTDVMAMDPTVDLVLLREDILRRIVETTRIIQKL